MRSGPRRPEATPARTRGSGSAARGLEERLSALRAMELAAGAPDAELVREALRSKIGVLVAAGARLVAARELAGLTDELTAAFLRLCDDGVKRDPGCRGKVAIVKAMGELGAWEDEVLLRGVSFVQKEPVWGGSEDSAPELRAECGMAFAHAGRSDALDVLADLLADPERGARLGAATALGDTGRPDAAALLRYKVRIDDPEPEVISACLGSILALQQGSALPFFARLLRGHDDRAAGAAMVLGESRLPAATPILISWCEETTADVRAEVGYLALALLRDEPANEYLLGRVRNGQGPDAIAAARALATFRGDPRLAARVREAADRREPSVLAAVEAALERPGSSRAGPRRG